MLLTFHLGLPSLSFPGGKPLEYFLSCWSARRLWILSPRLLQPFGLILFVLFSERSENNTQRIGQTQVEKIIKNHFSADNSYRGRKSILIKGILSGSYGDFA